MDGRIVIKTKIDNSEFRQQLKVMASESEDFAKNLEELLSEVDTDKDLDSLVDELLNEASEGTEAWKEAMGEAFDYLMQEYKELTTGPVLFDDDLQQAEELKKQMQALADYWERVMGSKIIIPGLVNADEKSKKLNTNFKDLDRTIKTSTSRIIRMGLSLIGITTLFGTISSSVSRITQKNEVLRGKINSIRNAIDNVVERLVNKVFPIIERIVQYVGYLMKQWLGIDIFKKSTKGAEKLKKALTSFDEANIIQDNGEKDYNIEALTESKTPGWLKWLGKNGKKLAKYLLIILGAIIGIKTGLGLIKGLGIGIALLGVYDTIKGIIDLIKTPSIDNFAKVLKGIGEIVLGIGIAFGSLPAIVTGALVLIVAGLILYYDKICGWFNSIVNYLDTFKDNLRKKIGPVADILLYPFTFAINFLKTLYEQFYGGIREAIGGVIKLFQGDLLGGITDIVSGIVKTMFAIPIAIFTAFKEVLSPIVTWVDENIIQPIKRFLQPIIDWVDNHIVTPLKNLFKGIKDFFTNLFKNIGSDLGTAIKTGLKAVLNAVISSVEAKLNAIRKVINDIIWVINHTNILGLTGIAKIPDIPEISLPRLAQGGIVHNAGPGVMMGNAIVGEGLNAEAVLPLDDMTLDRLGEAIARHSQINATIPVYVGNRQVAREIRKINAEDMFASNGVI